MSVPLSVPMSEPVLRVRITQRLDCPVCGRVAHGVNVRSGECWLNCRQKDLRRGHWWLNITLPPDARAVTLCERVGWVEGLALLTAADPTRFGVGLLGLETPLATVADSPVHVQVSSHAHDARQLRFDSLAQILRTLGLL